MEFVYSQALLVLIRLVIFRERIFAARGIIVEEDWRWYFRAVGSSFNGLNPTNRWHVRDAKCFNN